MKLGLIGNGKIVKELLSFINQIQDIELEAIAATSRSFDKSKQLSKEFGIKKAYENSQELLNDKEVDFVYIGIVNSMHYEIVKKALNAGKHIICEKPFTSNDKQLEELIELAKEKKLILLEAISNIHLPNVIEIKKSLKKIGNIKIVSLNYSQYSSRYDNFKNGIIEPVFDINKDGGALVDLNIYNLYLLVYLFGLPKKIDYLANIEKDIDVSGILSFDYGKFKAIAIGAKDSSAPLNSTIQGDGGSIVIETAPNEVKYFDLILNKKQKERINLQEESRHRMYYEFLEFKDIIENLDYEKSYQKLETSLKVMRLLTAVRKKAGIKYPSDL